MDMATTALPCRPLLVCCLLFTLTTASENAEIKYTVTATRNSNVPVIDKHRRPGSSVFDFNYNPANFHFNGTTYLMVRVQNKTTTNTNTATTTTTNNTDNNSPFPYGGPSVFAVSRVISPTETTPITTSDVVFGDGIHDVEDPRIVYDSVAETWYMYYTKSEAGNSETCKGPNPCARLSVATAKTNPTSSSSWVDHGPLWPKSDVAGFQWTKSGAVVPSSGGDPSINPHILIWSNWCTFNPWVSPLYVQIAYSYDSLLGPWVIAPSPLMTQRAAPAFDSYVLESGPPPVKLSTGDWLFLYNGAKHCQTTKPNYERCYAIGWVILDSKDPTKVVARSKIDDPLLVPTLEWEIGNSTHGDQTPNAVFIDGALFRWSSGGGKGKGKEGENEFIAFYGGSDTAVGSMTVKVEVSSAMEKNEEINL